MGIRMYNMNVFESATALMREIAVKPDMAICKDLMCARGIGENLGSSRAESNRGLRDELRNVFSAFYDRHVDEDDPHLGRIGQK